jgi:hypothetical protein
MREYDDDNIRLYTPVLQRIIILVAVIIAVPAVMWTITAFVRTYVAPPKVPTFQPLSLTPSPPPDNTAAQPPDDASASQQTASASAPADAQSPATQTASDPTQASDTNAPVAAPQVAATPVQQMAPPPPASAQPMPAVAAPATPDSANQAAAPPAANHDFAWPSPTTSPPTIPPANMASTATPSGQDQATSTSSDGVSADLPTVAPLAGRVPLPRHRPNVIAMAEPTSPSAVSPPAALPMSAVPLPRARPATAPEATPSPAADAPAPGGMDAGHY